MLYMCNVIAYDLFSIQLFFEKHLYFKTVKKYLYYDVKDYDWRVWCKFQPNSFSCTDNITGVPRFYYDTQLGDCKTFTYRHCPTTLNSFETITLCHQYCQDDGPSIITAKNISEKIFCRFQPDFGNCHDYHPMYYYDLTERTCKGFSYSGCGGNNNKFVNQQLCVAVCGHAVDV
ncbi:hypothetical protein K1T71_000363 [Dendrolimus kikuchii]|uniref:Uncharacterized protein n=1 Tax=Dendrolimus kikuchii TaxID=765133 RepID=A0ACC1DJG9_9NEOP|nr:hypothetical protein K1T71_000363 [Dendrolimus kikuchii]